MPKRRANGEGSIFVKKKDDNGKPVMWGARYTDSKGELRYLYGKTQQIVKDKLKEAIRLDDSGVTLEPRKVTFSDWVKEWLEVYHKPFVRGSTHINNCLRWKNHIAPYWGKVPLRDIRQETLQKYFNEKAEYFSSSSCVQLKNVVGGALKKAVELGYIPNNPVSNVRIPPLNHAEKQILSVEQQKQFERTVQEDIKADYNATIFLLMLYTGLRVGEALGLQIGDIDFDSKELYVRRTVGVITKLGGAGILFYAHDPKTKAGKRTIPLSDKVIDLLKTQIENRNQLVESCREVWESKGYDLDIADAEYLYITSYGNIINRNNLDRKLNRLLSVAGCPHVTPHGLRHTFATRWLEAGLDVRSLAEILGHSDVKMTLNVYTHALPEQKRKNMDALAELF